MKFQRNTNIMIHNATGGRSDEKTTRITSFSYDKQGPFSNVINHTFFPFHVIFVATSSYFQYHLPHLHLGSKLVSGFVSDEVKQPKQSYYNKFFYQTLNLTIKLISTVKYALKNKITTNNGHNNNTYRCS